MSGRNPAFEWRDAFAKAGYRGAPLAVGTWIGNHWNGDSRHPLAPVELLMRDLGYSRRSITLALARLRTDGWIALIHRGGRHGDGTAWASLFRLTVPIPEGLNVQSSAPQCAKDCTPVDQTPIDQTKARTHSLVDRSRATYDDDRVCDDESCPRYPYQQPTSLWGTPCPHWETRQEQS